MYPDDDDPADDFEVSDGNSVRTTRLFLKDTFAVDADLLSDHRPGFRSMSDAERAAVNDARDQMVRRAESAWHMDARRKKPNNDDDNDEDYEVKGGAGQRRTDPTKIGVSSLSVRSDDASIADARAAVTRSYHQMCRRLQDAWKRPSMDAAQPDNSSPPEVMRRFLHGDEPDSNNAEGLMQRHLRGDVPPDAGARERAIAQRNARLENAWRGQTEPRRATAIEKQREEWLGK